jgi:hypothetical protein
MHSTADTDPAAEHDALQEGESLPGDGVRAQELELLPSKLHLQGDEMLLSHKLASWPSQSK